jgi:hypothetical protein
MKLQMNRSYFIDVRMINRQEALATNIPANWSHEIALFRCNF